MPPYRKTLLGSRPFFATASRKDRVWSLLGAVHACVLVLVLGSGVSLGADWFFTPRLTAGAMYDTNLLLTAEDEKEDFVGRIIPEIAFSYRTQRFESRIRSLADGYKYVDNDDLDTIHHDHQVSVSYAALETLRLYADGSFRKDSTLDTELEEEGLRANRENRHRYGGTAGFDLAVSPVFSVSGSYSRIQTDYPDDPTDRSNYSMDSVSLIPKYAITARTFLSVYLGYDRTTYDDLPAIGYAIRDRSIETFSVVPTIRFDISERFFISGGVGYRHTKSEFTTDFEPALEELFPDTQEETSSDGLVLDLLLHGDWQKGMIELGFNRNQYSTVEGNSVERNRFTLRVQQRLTERLTLNGSAAYTKSTEDVGGQDSEYIYVSPSLDLRLMRNVSLSVYGLYARLEEESDAERFRGGLNLVITWDRLFSGS